MISFVDGPVLSRPKALDVRDRNGPGHSDAGKRDLALQAIAEKHQGNMLSLAEIKQLDQQAKQSKRFVAVISQFDRRFETAYVDYQEIEKIEQIPDVGKRDLDAEGTGTESGSEGHRTTGIECPRLYRLGAKPGCRMSHDPAGVKGRGSGRWLAVALYSLVAAAIPFAATAIGYAWVAPSGNRAGISVGVIVGVAVGQLVGVRRGDLAGYLLGPALGLLVGYLELKVTMRLYVYWDLPMWIVSVLPVWGLGFGVWIAMYRARPAVVGGLANRLSESNLASRLAQFVREGTLAASWRSVRRYYEPAPFVAPTIAIVLLTPARRRDT